MFLQGSCNCQLTYNSQLHINCKTINHIILGRHPPTYHTLTPNPLNSPLSPTPLTPSLLLHLLVLIKPPPSIQVNRRSIHPLPIAVINLRADVQHQHRDHGAVYREEVLDRGLLA
jgi:hypothetical protein